MSLNEQMDNYCERVGPEFWSEPLNAVTNAAFLVAALGAFLHVAPQDTGRLDRVCACCDCLCHGRGVIPVSHLRHAMGSVGGRDPDHTVYSRLSPRCPGAVPRDFGGGSRLASLLQRFSWRHLFIGCNSFLLLWDRPRATCPLWGPFSWWGPFYHRKNAAFGSQVLLTGVVFAVSLTFRTHRRTPVRSDRLWHPFPVAYPEQRRAVFAVAGSHFAARRVKLKVISGICEPSRGPAQWFRRCITI